MEQVQFLNAENQRKTAYQLGSKEFSDLLGNLRLFGDLAKVALIASNDRKNGLRPRVQPVKEAVELLHEVLGEENAEHADIALSDLDILRVERAEITWALQHPVKSELAKARGSVILGHATMAFAMNDLRKPIVDGSAQLSEPESMQRMLDQFHEDGVKRISAQV